MRDWRAFAENLPDKTGVYIFLDKNKTPIYVGKAKSLRNRVQSYFNDSSTDYRSFIRRLPTVLGDIETHITSSEKEALILERELIRRHAPRYNVIWRDDKQFLCLRIDPKHDYPWVQVVRNMKKDGARYFGPFHSAGAARKTLKVLNRHFKLRTCSDAELHRRERPCLEYQIGRCPAPCVLEIDQKLYRDNVKDVLLFLEGQEPELIKKLEVKMWEASEEFAYEVAAHLRDQIQAIQKTLQKQNAVLASMRDQDIVGIYNDGPQHCLAIMEVREGRVRDIHKHHFTASSLEPADVLQTFLIQYYLEYDATPEELVLPFVVRDLQNLEELLYEHRGRKTRIHVPKRGERFKLIALAGENAKHGFAEKRRKDETKESTLEALKAKLRLRRRPVCIECFDISHFQGDQIVASKVCFKNAYPDKRFYRRYRIKHQTQQDDFAAMYEVLSRRLSRGEREGDLPDLIVIDGGKGQLAAARAAMRDQEIENIDLISLAKARSEGTDSKKPERIFREGAKSALVIPTHAPEMRLLMAIRDEAHRFAVRYHTELRSKKTLRSDLDSIPGIGPKRRRALLTALGSVERVSKASLEELMAVEGFGEQQAARVYHHYR
jgi:excinuclease ABC subunit C